MSESAAVMSQHKSQMGIALTSLIAGLVSVVLLFVFFSMGIEPIFWVAMVVALLGVILGIVALKKRQSKGMAITGLVISIAAILLSAGLYVFALIFIGAIPI